MSSSKFAGLEGVDFDSPDVYETHSPSPTRKPRNAGRSTRRQASQSSSDNSDTDEDDDSDEGGKSGGRGSKKVGGRDEMNGSGNTDIVGTSIDPSEASKRFQSAAGVDGRHVDFSSSIQKRKKKSQFYPPSSFESTTYALGSGTGYRTSAGGEGPGDNERWTATSTAKESPIDKFRRLRYEMEELEKEIQGDPSTFQQGESIESSTKEEGVPKGLATQLSILKSQLVTLEERSNQGEPSSSTSSAEIQKLLERLSAKTSNGDVVAATEVAQEIEGHEGSVTTTDGSRIAEMDRRLASLEDLVGVKDAMIDETNSLPRPLLSSLARIEHLLTLLTHPRHLDGISRRIKVLVSELERLHEARRKLATTGGMQQFEDRKGTLGITDSTNTTATSTQTVMIPVDTMQKLDSILPMMSKMEPLIPIVPTLLARLHSLSALHTSSNSFVENLNNLEASSKRSQSNNEELKAMLGNLESSFAENQTRIQANLKVIEDRMENVTKRVQALQ